MRFSKPVQINLRTSMPKLERIRYQTDLKAWGRICWPERSHSSYRVFKSWVRIRNRDECGRQCNFSLCRINLWCRWSSEAFAGAARGDVKKDFRASKDSELNPMRAKFTSNAFQQEIEVLKLKQTAIQDSIAEGKSLPMRRKPLSPKRNRKTKDSNRCRHWKRTRKTG